MILNQIRILNIHNGILPVQKNAMIWRINEFAYPFIQGNLDLAQGNNVENNTLECSLRRNE
jgi:hypothetical protein